MLRKKYRNYYFIDFCAYCLLFQLYSKQNLCGGVEEGGHGLGWGNLLTPSRTFEKFNV